MVKLLYWIALDYTGVSSDVKCERGREWFPTKFMQSFKETI